MPERSSEPGAWFAPKRFGYGSGLPIAWQGWLALAVFLVALFGVMLLPTHSAAGTIAKSAGAVGVVALFVIVCARHTRGGWRWRWGDGD